MPGEERTVPAKQVAAFRAWLADQDVASLTDAERLDLLTELELLTRAVGGVSVRTQVSFHASQVAAQVEGGVAPSRAGRAVPDDLARARHTSPYWGSRELASAKALVTEMPCTLSALSKGHISLYQSRLVTEATACLDFVDRAEVDRRLSGSLAGTSTAEIAALVRGLVYEVDPNGFVERARKAAKDRGVSIRPCPDVMALLSARLPAAQAIASYRVLKDGAETMRASGDPRTLQQLMADQLFERLTGRSVVDGVDVEVGLVMTDSALFGGTSQAADLVGYGPMPAAMARDLLRPDDDVAERPKEHTNRHRMGPADDRLAPDSACPDGIRCPSWNCTLLHGSPDTSRAASSTGTGAQSDPEPPATPTQDGSTRHAAAKEPRPRPSPPPAPPSAPPSAPPESSAAASAARVWLRRLWIDPATGVLIGRDTRKRLFTGSLRATLIARDRTCRNTWCGAPIRAIDHKIRARDGGATSDTNGQGLCQRCNNAREHPRANPPAPEEYRPPPVLLPAFLADRSPPSAA